jgi:hypothetical protein
MISSVGRGAAAIGNVSSNCFATSSKKLAAADCFMFSFMVSTYHLDSQVYTEIITDGKRVTPRNVFSEYSGVKRVRPDHP